MKLTDLSARWLSPDVFMFRSPSGRGDWLTCKRVQMSLEDQYKLIYEDNPDHDDQIIAMSKPDFAWSFSGGGLGTITVQPSIDASASGNWHGFITDGEIVNV